MRCKFNHNAHNGVSKDTTKIGFGSGYDRYEIFVTAVVKELKE